MADRRYLFTDPNRVALTHLHIIQMSVPGRKSSCMTNFEKPSIASIISGSYNTTVPCTIYRCTAR